MTDFNLYTQIVKDEISKEIDYAQKKYGHNIVFTSDELARVSNWLNGHLEYWKDYEYLIDYDENHYVFFKNLNDLNWFILSNNLTSYTINI